VKSEASTRPYEQRARAAAAQATTERILTAAFELFLARPWEQIALADVAAAAGVGVQTIIRRYRTKEGLARAVTAWMAPQVAGARGGPTPPDPAAVAAAVAAQYVRWGAMNARVIQQEDVTPALAEAAATGRANHRAWLEATFADALAARDPAARHDLLARLAGVTGVELWLVLTRDGGLDAPAAEAAVADLVAACLTAVPATTTTEHPEP
jgi:AcrR family transcriptional regulator